MTHSSGSSTKDVTLSSRRLLPTYAKADTGRAEQEHVISTIVGNFILHC
jgi:hypothetical protein